MNAILILLSFWSVFVFLVWLLEKKIMDECYIGYDYKIILELNREKIRKIPLTDIEKEEAIFERQLKKYFHVKHEVYWREQEKIKKK